MDRQDEQQQRDRSETDEVRRRAEAASGGEPAAGIAAESAGEEGRTGGQGEARAAEKPAPDQVTEADKKAQTAEAERVQQAGEGIHGVSTQGREDQEAEDEVRRAAEGRD